MIPQERYEKILYLLKQKNVLKIEELVTSFGISVETARRDLNYLEKEGFIKKVYGGATLVKPMITEPVSSERLAQHTDEKRAIGKKCSEFINDGDSVLLEIGTTTLQVAKHIKEKKKLTIVTNSIYVINELIDTSFDLYMIGGKVRHEEWSVSGSVSLLELEQFHFNKAIIGAGAVTAKNGISDYNIEESLVRKKIIERSKEIILVADHSKFGFDAFMHVCPIESIDIIVTGKDLSQEIISEFQELNVQLVLAEE